MRNRIDYIYWIHSIKEELQTNNLTNKDLLDWYDTKNRSTNASALITVQNWCENIGWPLLLISGTILNTLTIIVFSRNNLRTSNTSILLRILAVTDTAALYFDCFPQWLYKLSAYEIGWGYSYWISKAGLFGYSYWKISVKRTILTILTDIFSKACKKFYSYWNFSVKPSKNSILTEIFQ